MSKTRVKKLFRNDENYNKYQSNFQDVECDAEVSIRDSECNLSPAIPLNNDPDIQKYGAVVNLLHDCIKNKKYKLFNKHVSPEDFDLCDYYTKEPIGLYDVVGILDSYENFNLFTIFTGIKNDNKLCFEYLDLHNDEIRYYTVEIPTNANKMWCDDSDVDVKSDN